MLRLKLGAIARADLANIRRYSVREFGPDVADAYFRGFGKAFDLLRSRPYAGQARPAIASDARSLTHRQHRILYRIEGDRIVIVRVQHHAQEVDWPL
jgi:toxin ParE1/3/4